MTSQLFRRKLMRLRKLSATKIQISDFKKLWEITTMSDEEFEDFILARRI